MISFKYPIISLNKSVIACISAALYGWWKFTSKTNTSNPNTVYFN